MVFQDVKFDYLYQSPVSFFFKSIFWFQDEVAKKREEREQERAKRRDEREKEMEERKKARERNGDR